MSDQPIDPPEPEPEGDENGESIADLRRAAKGARDARDEADKARRELAFAKAGIDTETGVGKLAFQSYDGEPTRDAVLAFAAEYGISPTTPAETTAPAIGDDEQRQTRERAALHVGSEVPPTGTPDVHPENLALSRFREALANGDTRDQAASDYFGTMFAAANAGDERATFDSSRWKAENRGSARTGGG